MLRLSPAAEQDIEDAARWYDEQVTGLGDRFLAAARAVFERIGSRPLAFPVALGTARRALLNRFPYSVYYEADDQGWIVLAVLHQRRSPDTLRKRIKS